jgi:hypothetical protein
VRPLPRFNTEGAAVAEPDEPAVGSLATLLTRHILRDGELVLLALKPSVWFILLSSMRFLVIVLILMIASKVFDRELPSHPIAYIEAGLFLMVGRLMWAVMQWTSRLYVLTDLRILRIAGVFNVTIFDCPLRKIARTRLIRTFREKVLGLGSIEIIPMDEDCPFGMWQMIGKAERVHETVVATINRAKHSGCGK